MRFPPAFLNICFVCEYVNPDFAIVSNNLFSYFLIRGIIDNEKNNNPRLQVTSAEEYAKIMNNLKLEDPKIMDIAITANKKGIILDQ